MMLKRSSHWKIFLKDINTEYFIDNDSMMYLSKYYSADPAYYTNKILKHLDSKDLIPIIKPNIKNTKDKAKLKKLKLNTYQNKIYARRFKIEDTNSNIKSFKLVQTRMDCSNNSFGSSLFISYINKVQRYL